MVGETERLKYVRPICYRKFCRFSVTSITKCFVFFRKGINDESYFDEFVFGDSYNQLNGGTKAIVLRRFQRGSIKSLRCSMYSTRAFEPKCLFRCLRLAFATAAGKWGNGWRRIRVDPLWCGYLLYCPFKLQRLLRG